MPTDVNTHPLVYIRSVSTTHFTGVLAQNAMEVENIAFPAPISHTNEVLIEGINIQSVQNLDWDVFIWTQASAANASLDLDRFLDYVYFPLSSAKQIAGAGQYYYSSTGMMTRYKDLDLTKTLHVGLVNRSAVSKNAGPTGAVVVNITVSPVLFV